MAALKNVIYLSNEDYELLITNGTVTIGNTTLTYDEDNLYITPEKLASITEAGLMSAEDKVKLNNILNRAAASGGTDDSLVTTGDKYRWNNMSGDNQTIKVGSTEFGVNDVINFVAGTNVTITPATTGTDAPKITISATDTTYTLTQPTGEANKVRLVKPETGGSQTTVATVTVNDVAHATAADSAESASTAGHADSADSATNASNLGNHAPSYYAVDTNVVHKTGDETVAGEKTFSTRPQLVGSRLPTEYQEVTNLIFNSSTGYVDSQLVITVADNLSIEMDASWRGNNTSFATFFGYMKSSQEVTPRCAFSIYSNRYMIGIDSTTSSSTAPASGRHIYKFYTNNGNQILTVDDIIQVQTSYSSSALTNNQLTSYIGARNTANTAGNFADIDVYSVKITHNNVGYDLVPCYRKSDNKTGFYDTIHNTFLPSTGGVTKGDDVSSSTFAVMNDFAAVAFTGEYSSLKNTPTSRAAAQNGTDLSLVTTGEKYTWNNKSDFSGNYNDLTNKPTIPTDYVKLTTNQTIDGVKSFTSRPTLKVEHIPSAYQAVTYVQTENTYINTGIKANSAYTYKFKVSRTSPYSSNIWGVKLNSGYSADSCLILGWTNNHIAIYSHSGAGNNISEPSVVAWGTDYHEIEFNATSSTFIIDGENKWAEYTATGTTNLTNAAWSSNTYNLYLGGTNTAGTAVTGGAATWAKYEVWNGDTLLQQLIPCYRKSDNAIGFYDTVADTFLTKSGSGTLTKGVNLTDSDFLVFDDLADVAISGSYNDLSNKPTLPTVNDTTITIKKNNADTGDSFTTNTDTAKTINLGLSTVATSGSYNDLSNKPIIPTNADYVDLTTNQTVGGTKTFTSRPALQVERLPNTYQEVTYLHADGNQYINTGIPGHMGWTYKLIYQQDNAVSYRCWGVFNQSSYNGGLNMSLTYTFPDWMLRWETTSGQTRNVLLAPIDTNQHTLVVDNGETYFDNVYKGVSAAHDSSVVSNYNVYLFTINPGGTTPTTNLVGKIFYYEVYDNNGVLQQQFIPCIRKSDNKPGFYDLVSNTFKTNASGSSTDFTVGANVVNSEFLVAADLAAVATSGDYTDLINRPTIPTDTNQKIKANGTTFSDNAIINLIPGDNVTITPATTGTGAPSITIEAIDTTYESLSEELNGDDISLVTTGEKYNWNHLNVKPDGTNTFLSSNKINTVYLPDYILGQLVYGGTLNASTAVATLSADAKSKLGTTSNTITLTNNTTAITGYSANKGIYYIVSTAGTFATISFSVGDWCLSDGSKWTKIDNTDAVSSVQVSASTPLSSSVNTAQTGVVSTTISHNKVLGDSKATTTLGIYGIAVDTYGHITNLSADTKISSSRVDDGNPYQAQVGATRFVTSEMYEYLDDKLYQRPAISTFTLYNNGSAVSTTVEKGTTVTVGQIRHLETNITNIATLKLDSEDITPVSSTTTATLTTPLTITATTTKTLSGTNTKGESFTKTATINVYSYAYSKLATSTTTPTSGLTKQSVYTTFQSSGASFSYTAGQYLYLYVPSASTASKIQTNVLGQWVDVAYTSIGAVTITKANSTTESYKCFRTTGTFSSSGTATYRVA